MFENIAISVRSIWSHKLRSLLTMLGIIIGIAAIITIVSTIKGTNDQIKANLIGAGTNVVTVSVQRADGSYVDLEYGTPPEGVLPIDEETRQELLELGSVEDCAFYCQRSWCDGVSYKNTAFSGNVIGADSHYLKTNSYRVALGRGFLEEDFADRRKVVLLDTKAMESLFDGQNPIGETMEFMGVPFTVVGVVESTAKSSVTINNLNDYYMYADTSSGTLFVPLDDWPILYRYDEPYTVSVKASSTDAMAEVGSKAAALLTEECVSNSDYLYKADDLLAQASELQSLSASTNNQLIWIAGISLLVGGIGVMNIMLVSVTERTREIGLKMAIGARRKRILRQFLTEAGVLTSLGGILGVGVGIGLSQALSGVMGTPVSISAPACLIAVAFSMVIGIAFGLIPAVKASRLNPIEALRWE